MMKSPSSPPEPSRRIAVRRVLREEATVAHGSTRAAVQTWDVGRDGISIVATRPIAPGTRCQVEFGLPIDGAVQAITAAAKVVYSSYSSAGAFKIGAVFTDLSDDVADLLARFASGD